MFRGWWVVAGAFLVTFVGFGNAYSFSAFIAPLQNSLDASRGSVSLIFSLAGFLYFLVGVISGPLADRCGARPLAMLGMLITGAGMIGAGFAHTLTTVYISYGLGVGLGVGLSYAPVIAAVQRWFVRRRGIASGLAVCGIGIGTLVVPPFAAYTIHVLGWQLAYMVLGVTSIIVGCGASLLIADGPQQYGLLPDGDAGSTQASTQMTGLSMHVALHSWRFVGLYLAGLVLSFGLYVPFVHLVPFAEGHGIAAASAVLLVSMIGVGSTVGRFFLGGVADHLGHASMLTVMLAGVGFSMLLWEFSQGIGTLMCFAFIFGVFYGGFVAIAPTVIIEDFGPRNVSGLLGILYSSNALGTLLGPSLAGIAFDLYHSYTLPIFASAATGLVAACLFAATASSGRRVRKRLQLCTSHMTERRT